MPKLENYNGSVSLIAGITQKGGGDFPLVDANAVQTQEDGTRLDEELARITESLTDVDETLDRAIAIQEELINGGLSLPMMMMIVEIEDASSANYASSDIYSHVANGGMALFFDGTRYYNLAMCKPDEVVFCASSENRTMYSYTIDSSAEIRRQTIDVSSSGGDLLIVEYDGERATRTGDEIWEHVHNGGMAVLALQAQEQVDVTYRQFLYAYYGYAYFGWIADDGYVSVTCVTDEGLIEEYEFLLPTEGHLQEIDITLEQHWTDDQRTTARTNIGAASAEHVEQLVGDLNEALDAIVQIQEDLMDGSGESITVNVQANWAQTDDGQPDYIKSKPFDEVDDALDIASTNPVQNCAIAREFMNIDTKVGVLASTAVLCTAQTLTDAQKSQARKNIDFTDTVNNMIDSKISGIEGKEGEAGATFTPSVSEDGVISWTNDGGLENPMPVNIRGPKGDQGEQGPKGDKGDDGVSATHSWDGTVLTITSSSGTSSADLKGEKGDTGDGLRIVGSFTSAQNLEAAYPSGPEQSGDLYLINGVLYSWIGNEWLAAGDIKGTKGDKGIDGVSATHSWDGSIFTITSASGTTKINIAQMLQDMISDIPDASSQGAIF